jgi:hypothetical protein
MKIVRVTLSAGIILALCWGYAQSQLAVFAKKTAEHALAADSAPWPTVALVVLALALIFAFVRDADEETGS